MSKESSYIKLSEKISNLIKDFLGGKEEGKLNEWINSSEENRELYDEIVSEKNLNDKIFRYSLLDTELYYRELEHKIKKVKIRKLRIRYIKYVAIFMFPMMIASLFYIVNNSKQIEKKYYNNELLPGGAKAVLMLSSGEVLNLEGSGDNKQDTVEGAFVYSNKKKLQYNDKRISNDKVFTHKIVVPRGGEYIVELSDGTNVYLFAESSLSYPSKFTGNKREVVLTGEAYFDVSRDIGREFIVKAGGANIKVLGTSFNVMAYEGLDIVETSLIRGKVVVNNTMLTPNKQAVFNKETKEIGVRDIRGKDYEARSNGMFVFYEKTLDEILKELSRWYDFEYFYENKSVASNRYVVRIPKYQKVNDVFDIIEMTKEVKFGVKGKSVVIRDIK